MTVRSSPSSEFRALNQNDRVAACIVALSHLPAIGPVTVRRCHLEHGAVESWFDIVSGHVGRVVPVVEQLTRTPSVVSSRVVASARLRDPAADLTAQLVAGRRVHVLGTASYPRRLQRDVGAPAVLFSEGNIGLIDMSPTVAIVGTRNATLSGRQLAEVMGAELAGAGVVVVSGLALGIDGAAHRGAIAAAEAQGRPPSAVGVIASGLDISYPRRHAHIHRALAVGGLLVTETPAGVRPDAWRFPARNRIIAALADAVVVVESRATGGSMHTVEEALVRDVPVLAVPGHPSAPASEGTNSLLYDGAAMARNSDDVFMALGMVPPRPSPGRGAEPPAVVLAPAEDDVLAALGATPSSLAELVTTTGRTLAEVAYALSRLEVIGQVARSGAWYEAVPHGARAR